MEGVITSSVGRKRNIPDKNKYLSMYSTRIKQEISIGRIMDMSNHINIYHVLFSAIF